MTGCQRILELLSDGREHSHLELYALGTVAHSRVSDLRKRGYVIQQRREGDHYLYRLVPGPALGETDPWQGAADASAPCPALNDAASSVSPSAGTRQLSLDEAAA